MSEEITDFTHELKRIHRVSDMLCSAHAAMRDHQARKAAILDISILGLSIWLLALVFVDPAINVVVTPLHLNPTLWLGLVSVLTFFLSMLQVKVDWKGRADKHAQALAMYASVKRECSYLLASERVLPKNECHNVLARYEMAGSLGVEIPEKDFLKQKRRHLLKIALSKHLDTHPSTSMLLVKFQWWWRDNHKAKE
jgi:hypothetical protein